MNRTAARVGLALALASLASTAQAQIVSIRSVNPKTTQSSSGSGGRTNGIAVHPDNRNFFYAATEYGGLFKSTDGGRNWRHLDGHVPVVTLDVKALAGTNTVIATSLYDGRRPSQSGINVSFDGGATWTRPATAVPPPGTCANEADQDELSAFGIAVDAADPAKIYVGTSCGLAVSSDAGLTWTYSTPAGPGMGVRLWDVVSALPDRADVCGDNGHYAVVNGVWSPGTGLPSGVCSIAASPYHPTPPNLFATVGTQIYETTDGLSWTLTRTNPSPQGRVPFVATNKRSGAPNEQRFDLWFGDVGLHRARCEGTTAGTAPRCGTENSPPWSPPYKCAVDYVAGCVSDADCPGVGDSCDKSGYSWRVGGHVDMGALVFDPMISTDACPLLNSNDGGVYYNTKSTSPDCHDPVWQQPAVTPDALLVYTMDGTDDPSSPGGDHVYLMTQDNGGFVCRDMGADGPWSTPAGGDLFTAVASLEASGPLIFTTGGTLFKTDTVGWDSHSAIPSFPTDPGGYPGATQDFRFTKTVVRNGAGYAWITKDGWGATAHVPPQWIWEDGGLIWSSDILATPLVWRELGNATEPQRDTVGVCSDNPVRECTRSPNNCGGTAACVDRVPCAVYTASRSLDSVFYVQTGDCSGDATTDQIWKFVGLNPAGTWQPISLPNGGGVGIFAVDPNDPDHLIASELLGGACDPNLSDCGGMYKSTDGGATWFALSALTRMMRGDSANDFPFKNKRGYLYSSLMTGYHQPSFVAIDPVAPSNVIAGGRDSGIFYSTDRGITWSLVTDPRTPAVSRTPHIPRPKHAYFSEADHNKSIYVSSQGRGLWRFDICRADPFEPDDDPSSANTIGSGETQPRSICGTGNPDYARLFVNEPSSLTISTSANSGSLNVKLLDPQLRVLAEAPTGLEIACGSPQVLLPGQYLIVVEEAGLDDTITSYTLSLNLTPCCGNAAIDANAGETCDDGNLIDGDCCSSVCALEDAPIPAVTAATMTSTQITWPALGEASAYDVVVGDLGEMRRYDGDFTGSARLCLADDDPATAVDHTSIDPIPGGAAYFLVRGVRCGGSGTFDDLGPRLAESRDGELALSGLPCTTP